MVELVLTRKAQKFYEQADPSLVRRLNRCFEPLRQDPYSHANIKQLEGVYAGYFRYRVGDWRVIYRIEVNQTDAENTDEFSQTSSVITIVIIAHRRDVYREN